MAIHGNHCSFVLLAEFHLLEGAQLKYQFPQPLGVDEQVLAMSMLPDGAEMQMDDWTIFFLNQTPFNTIAPVIGLDSPDIKAATLPGDEPKDSAEPGLLCVLNLVRTKLDKSLNRGAKVLALAICTRHPFIQIFKPVLLMALDDYLANPSQDCLARLFDAVNSMDLSRAPALTRFEKIVMRSSERKDIFAEKFEQLGSGSSLAVNKSHRSMPSTTSFSSFEDTLQRRMDENAARTRDWDETIRGRGSSDPNETIQPAQRTPPSDTSFTLGGSAVWVGDETGLDDFEAHQGGYSDSVTSLGVPSTLVGSGKRRSTDTSSLTSHTHISGATLLRPPMPATATSFDSSRSTWAKDTHFFHTTVAYRDHQLPIMMPLSTFPEEVGDYSLITLIKVFSGTVTGPLHPHLHSNGPQTHPIIVLFNALVTGKRIIFLGHKRPAGEVSSFVLAACALGSGCGAVLRGFIERAFPYANLNNREEWEAVPAYIAGVTNPIFEALGAWDLLLDISTGSVVVAKDIHATYPQQAVTGINPPLVARTGTLKAESSLGEEDIVKPGDKKNDFAQRAEHSADAMFIEDIKTAIEFHYGESLVRGRFIEYVTRFVRLASRYEEETQGSTNIGYPSHLFLENAPGRPAQLGSGVIFNDEQTGMKEISLSAPRVEAWRKTNSYQYFMQDFKKSISSNPIRGFDVVHQIFRLRHAKKMADLEVSMLMQKLADNVKTYDQVVELLSYLMPHSGGILPLSFGLLHQDESVRNWTVDLFNQIRSYPVGVIFLQSLNHFQRYAYVRQAHVRREKLHAAEQPSTLYPPALQAMRRTHSGGSMSISQMPPPPPPRVNGTAF